MRRILSAIRRRVFPHLPSDVKVSTKFVPYEWFKTDFNIRTVVDIGANDGAYGAVLGSELNVERAYFFEPQRACHASIELAAKGLRHAEIFGVALSDEEGETVFIETNESPSASLLPLSQVHRDAFPNVVETGRTTVEVRRLDDVLRDREMPGDVLVKIDVQGVEDRVIRGGRETFSRASIVLIEVSFQELYEGQALFEDIHEALTGCGLRLAGLRNQIANIRPLFAHFIYVRPRP